jgi:ribosome-binding factor A
MTRSGRGKDRSKSVAAELLRTMQELLVRGGGLSDPRLKGLITVTGVEVSSDLKAATVMVSVLPEKNEARVLAGLTHAAAHLRHEAGEVMDWNAVPRLDFRIDHGPKKQAAVVQALSRAAAEREERAAGGQAGGDGAAGGKQSA